MRSRLHAVTAPWRRAGLAVGLVCLPVAAAPPDPADPAASTPATDPAPVLPAGSRDYLRRVDEPRLPWPALFAPDGTFVPDPAAGAAVAPSSAGAPPAPAAPDGGGTRGVVRRVDAAQGKVTIKHGPIDELGMPGMTMSFRAKDPALLDGLAAGDEVAFDVSVEGTTFFVTGLRKAGAPR